MAYLCHSPSTLWSVPSLRPDPGFFEDALRKQRVNGNVLLKGVNEEVLRKDLGFEAFGDRFVVLEVIRRLQERSVKYAENLITQGKLLSFIPYSKH